MARAARGGRDPLQNGQRLARVRHREWRQEVLLSQDQGRGITEAPSVARPAGSRGGAVSGQGAHSAAVAGALDEHLQTQANHGGRIPPLHQDLHEAHHALRLDKLTIEHLEGSTPKWRRTACLDPPGIRRTR